MLEEGVTAYEDVPYETWLREKLSAEKRRMENSVCNIYDGIPSTHNSSRVYRSVSTVGILADCCKYGTTMMHENFAYPYRIIRRISCL